MSIFEAYDTEFGALAESIGKEFANLRAQEDGGNDGGAAIRMLEALLSQSLDLIKQMEVEVRSHDGPTRKQLGDKVSHYKKSLMVQKTDLASCKNKIAKAHLRNDGNDNGDRSRLLGVNDKLYRQNEAIQNASRTVFETEEVGADIVEELGRNREKIQSAHDRVREFGGVADGARRLVSSMQRRDNQHKFLMYALYASLLIALLIGIYYAMSG
jgi:vesicle transport through interaction with t-SNAREs 1